MAMQTNANIIIYILGGVSIILIAWIVMLEIRLKKLFKGNKPKSLENLLIDINSGFNELNNSRKEIEEYLQKVEGRLKRTVQNVKMIRFNPFNDSGSNQSFAIALLDESGNGAVITGLYSREKLNVYAKPINNYQSEYKLTSEEKEVINKTKTEK